MNVVNLFPSQPDLRLILPTVQGNVDYHDFRLQLTHIDEMLQSSGLEEGFITESVKIWLAAKSVSKKAKAKQQIKQQERARRALRCNIARALLGEDHRGFSMRLADSQLLQWFCGIDRLVVVRVPSKSEQQRFSAMLPEEKLRPLINQLTAAAALAPAKIGLDEALDLDAYFVDTTCVKTNIHYPVDWVLLGDGTRTLLKATILIRKHGLKNRMESPEEFMCRMNRLCIQMTHTRRKADGKKQRKAVLRLMKRIVKSVKDHARKHRDLLDGQWEKTDWTRPQAQQVIDRIDRVLALLPQAEKQAHERIIGERQVANGEKVVSLYETDTQIIVRGKTGAEVEFGNTLRLVETPQGLIVEWNLFKDSACADSAQLKDSVANIEKSLGVKVKAICGDRGFDSKENQLWLDEHKIFNGICPRSPKDLKKRMEEEKFADLQKRRSQTEGRIAIVKNKFLGRPMRAKGFENRQMGVAWCVLTHNLWCLARLRCAQEQEQLLAA
jgi:IS5 family transposase